MKIEINGKLPKGFKLVNGKVVRTMAEGGNVNKTLSPIPRDQANLEAEKGETALTDLTNDGSFELYNIGGKRHTEGGTPLNLPEQSFVYSDTRKMLLSVEELKSLGIVSKKKMTPAEASKKFPLNEYIEILDNENSDKISVDTAEEMIDKNKIKLSQIAFLQESKKDFADGLPLAAYPFLISKGINPQELEAKIAEKNGPQQNPSPQMSQEQMAMGPQQGNLQQFTGPPQGGPPMPPQGGMPPMGPPMGKYGTELPSYQITGEKDPCADLQRIRQDLLFELHQAERARALMDGGMDVIKGTQKRLQQVDRDIHRCMVSHKDNMLRIEHEKRAIPGSLQSKSVPSLEPIMPSLVDESQIPKAMFGMAGLKYANPFMKNKDEKLKEDMGNMMSMGKMFAGAKYGGEPCPVCGKTNCGCNYKTGGQLPKAQKWGEIGKGIVRGYNHFRNIPSTINRAIPPVVNPTAFSLTDNWAFTTGAYTPKITTTKLNLGDENIGLINRESYPYTANQANKLGNFLNQSPFGSGTSRVDRVENVKVWDKNQGLGVGTSLYDQSLKSLGEGENFMSGLISGQQSVNPMEAPEKTVGMWKYFNKERVVINEDSPAFGEKDKLWQDAGDEDFSKYLVTDEKTGTVTYTGPEVRLLELNDAGKAKVDQTLKFYKQLELEAMGTGPNGSSPILNWENTIAEASQTDPHSPLGRYVLNGFKKSFGREPRIGNGKKIGDYNKASLYLLLAAGTFAFFNQDKIDGPSEQEKWDKFVNDEALEYKFIKEDGSADIDAYQHWVDIGSPKDSLPAAYEEPKYQYIEDSIEEGLDIRGMKFGGAISPFKANALKQFINGGDPTHPENLLMGAAPGDRTVSGGMIPEVNIWDEATPKIGPGEQMLMDMGEQRRLLLQSYAGIKDRADKNPNILEDPEEAGKIQYQINQIEEQIAAIDLKTSTIEQQLLQERLQLDPFSEDGTPPQARYGGSLPKFQNKGETYKEFVDRTGRPVQKGIPMDSVYDDTRGAFISTEMIDREQKSSDSSFTYRNAAGEIVEYDPYNRPNRSIVNGVDVGEFEVDANGDIVMENGQPKKNVNYDADLFTKGNLGADNHADFYNVMRQDAFSNVRSGWLNSSFDEIANSKTPNKSKYGQAAVDAHNELKALAIAAKANPGGVEEQQLFGYFNNMNRLLQMSAKTGRTYSNSTREVEKHAKALGLPVPSQLEIMAFQGMYGGLARTKETGSDADKALLNQVQTQFGVDQKGANKVGKGYVSNIDGWIGATSGEQFLGVVGNTEVEHKLKEFKVGCKGKEREAKMKECQDKTEKAIAAGETKRFRFKEPCDCEAYETPPEIGKTEKPRYETFVQDDMAVQVKSGQFPDLINPTRQATPDPAMVDPMYVDPRQQLSSLEATAAAAVRAGADPTLVMGSLQDQSEKVINKHESLNTKIYNNAMNINVPALQQFTQSKAENEKQYMDEAAMAMGNYQTEYKDAEDALLSAEQNQMSNADEMYIRNLENPNYWFSPKDHNIHFYNEKNVDGSITPGPVTYEKALEMCKTAGFTPEHGLNKCINDRMGGGGGQAPINTNRPSDEVITSLGTEVKSFSKRQADLQKSRKKLNKWITGH